MNLKVCRNLKMPNDGYVFPQIIDYLGEITRYTIVAWIVAIENKCCTLGGLVVTRLYMLVTLQSHYKYIVSLLSCLSLKVEKGVECM